MTTIYGICQACGGKTISDGTNITCLNIGAQTAQESELAIAEGRDPNPCKRSEKFYTFSQWKALDEGVQGE